MVNHSDVTSSVKAVVDWFDPSDLVVDDELTIFVVREDSVYNTVDEVTVTLGAQPPAVTVLERYWRTAQLDVTRHPSLATSHDGVDLDRHGVRREVLALVAELNGP